MNQSEFMTSGLNRITSTVHACQKVDQFFDWIPTRKKSSCPAVSYDLKLFPISTEVSVLFLYLHDICGCLQQNTCNNNVAMAFVNDGILSFYSNIKIL